MVVSPVSVWLLTPGRVGCGQAASGGAARAVARALTAKSCGGSLRAGIDQGHLGQVPDVRSLLRVVAQTQGQDVILALENNALPPSVFWAIHSENDGAHADAVPGSR